METKSSGSPCSAAAAKEVEIGKLPINTNHRAIQYPREILRRVRAKGRGLQGGRGNPPSRVVHEITLFQRFPLSTLAVRISFSPVRSAVDLFSGDRKILFPNRFSGGARGGVD